MKQKAVGPVTEPQIDTQVDDFFFHFVHYVYLRRKLFIALVLLVLAVIFSILGWFEYQEAQNISRDKQLYQLESQLKDLKTQPKALVQLETFLKKNPGTTQANLAHLYRANLLGASGDLLKAGFELEQLLNQLEPNSGLYVVVQVNLANLLRDQGKEDEALEVLDRGAGRVMQDALLIEKAEIYFVQKKVDQTKTTLDSLIKAYPNSLYKQRAQQLLKAL